MVCCAGLMSFLPRTALMAMAVLPLPTAALAADLAAPVASVSEELRQAWRSDPDTKDLPSPEVVLLPADQQALEVCPQARAAGAVADSSAVDCPSSNQVLLDQKWLGKDVYKRYGNWGLAYWIATGLGQAIRRQIAIPGPALNGAAANLQANCLAGVLMRQRSALRPSEPKQLLSPAFNAYAGSDNASQGKPHQRAYALLTGLGGTSSDCSSQGMVALSEGSVPQADTPLLAVLQDDPNTRAKAIQRQFSLEQLHKRPVRSLSQSLAL
jgi:hypothetical protein